MTTHVLKTWPAYFDAVASGAKTFEIRRDDRGFQKGDIVELRRYDPRGDHWHQTKFIHSLPSLKFEISWILTGGQFGLEPGYVALALKPLSQEGEPSDG